MSDTPHPAEKTLHETHDSQSQVAAGRVYLRPQPTNLRRFWYCLGGLTLVTAVMQALSGIVLAFYYQPTPERAYPSIFFITHYVKYGWFIRSVHVWGARMMVLLLLGHMLRVYLSAAYKHPRELNWVAGTFLLVATMGFSLTGSLLPWDQKAYWGTAGALALLGKTPLVGDRLTYFVVGGDAIGAPALSRFYTAHIMVLPSVLTVLLYLHFRMVRSQGIAGPL